MHIYLGDSGPLSSWTYDDDPLLTVLIFAFTFFTVIYLMNLFIGLLNMAIEKYDKYEEFVLSKAQVFYFIWIINIFDWLGFSNFNFIILKGYDGNRIILYVTLSKT